LEESVKIVNYAAYIEDNDRVVELRPAHRHHMDELLAAGKLVAGGPFTDGSGALFIYEVGSLAEAEELIAVDPYAIGGAFSHYELKEWDVVKSNPTLLP
jgi:uncharacterized protein YciI